MEKYTSYIIFTSGVLNKTIGVGFFMINNEGR